MLEEQNTVISGGSVAVKSEEQAKVVEKQVEKEAVAVKPNEAEEQRAAAGWFASRSGSGISTASCCLGIHRADTVTCHLSKKTPGRGALCPRREEARCRQRSAEKILLLEDPGGIGSCR